MISAGPYPRVAAYLISEKTGKMFGWKVKAKHMIGSERKMSGAKLANVS